MQDWDRLRLFTLVADSGSFSEAARKLDISQPALSRQIRALEKELDVQLFHRHARGTVLTHDGQTLYAETSSFSKSIETTRRDLSESGAEVRGQLTVTMTMGFGTQWLVPRLEAFHDAYPDLELDLVLSDSDISLGEGDAEMAIRFHSAAHADDIQRPLMPIKYRLYAGPHYIDRHGEPKKIADLAHHRIITYGPMVSAPNKNVNWLLSNGRPPGQPRKPILTINNVHGIRRAVMTGLGIASLPEYIVSHTEDIVEVLHDVEGPEFQAYVVYPLAMKNARRIQAFRDFLLKEAASFKETRQ
ncbi:MAG: LysR family transcriptional regulator [Sphingomonadales bacterium]